MLLATFTSLLFINKCLCTTEDNEEMLKEQAEYYGMNSNSDNSKFNVTHIPYVLDLISNQSTMNLFEFAKIIEEVHLPEMKKLTLTHEFPGWPIFDKEILARFENRPTHASKALNKIFEFSISNSTTLDFDSYSPQKILELFQVITFGHKDIRSPDKSFDSYHQYFTILLKVLSQNLNLLNVAKIESLSETIRAAAEIIINNFDNLRDDWIKYYENNKNELVNTEVSENPSTSQYLPTNENNEVQNQPDSLVKIQNELDDLCTRFMNDFRDVHNEILNEWNSIFSSNDIIQVKKGYVEAMHVKHNLLLNFKNIMMILFNSIRILKNEKTLKSFEIEIKDSIDDGSNTENIQDASSNSSIKKEVLLKSIDTDLKTLLTNYCVSLVAFSVHTFSSQSSEILCL